MLDKPRVLIVEDNVDLAEVTCELLGLAGHQAIYRTSIADALDALTRHAGAIAVLMTDINLSTPMSGIELAVYTSQEWPEVALCVTSGFAAERPRRLPEKAIFLGKPWQHDELLAFVHQACGRP